MLHITSPQQRWPASVASGGVCFVVYHPRSDSIVRWTIFSSYVYGCVFVCLSTYLLNCLRYHEIFMGARYGRKLSRRQK